MSETITYTVPGIHCGHCVLSIKEEVSEVSGVEAVDVDVEAKVVTIRGEQLSDDTLRAAIAEAGYEAT
jgi:copper chaperone